MTESDIMRIEKVALTRFLHEQPAFSELFVAHLFARTIRVEEDLVDQLFNSSEKRLARSSTAREFRQGGQTRTHHHQDQPGDARRDDRDNPGAG
jgi:hypothetical protein